MFTDDELQAFRLALEIRRLMFNKQPQNDEIRKKIADSWELERKIEALLKRGEKSC